MSGGTGQAPKPRMDWETKDGAKVPLTKSERRHVANLERRDAKRERAKLRRQDANERDAQLKAINDEYAPRIKKLQDERAAKLQAVWTQWRRTREERTA